MNTDIGYQTYLFTYRYENAEWGLTIKARTAEEAKARLARIPYATYNGEVMATIPVFKGISGIVGRIAKFVIRDGSHP